MTTQETFLAAVEAGDVDRVQRLLDGEPSLAESKNQQGVSLLLHAMYHRQPDCAEAIAAKRSQLDAFEAAALGKSTLLAELVTDANAFTSDGFNILMLAAFFSQADAVKTALDLGTDPNAEARNPSKLRAIHSAVAAGHAEITAILLSAGADPNVQQSGGYTPLMSAALHGRVDLAKALLAAGADPSLTADDGRTAKSMAQEEGHDSMVPLLEA